MKNEPSVKEHLKLQNWCNVSIAVTKNSKFESETTTVGLFLGCYVSVNCFYSD